MRKHTRKNIYFVVGIIFLIIILRILFLRFSAPVFIIKNIGADTTQNFEQKNSSVKNHEQEVIQDKKEVLSPPPLQNFDIADTLEQIYTGDSGYLGSKEVILFTNIQRERYGLVPLSENSQLNNSAEMKVNDIFEKQYFEHISPDGTNIEKLCTKSGYNFILIGENLAMGNFKNGRDLVETWMASPVHRANILKNRYREIGVSAKQGIFQGRKVWVAVQHFGLNLKTCPEVDQSLKSIITDKTQSLDVESVNLEALKASIESSNNKESLEYQNRVKEYNEKIKNYNKEINTLKEETSDYNNQVKLFNDCTAGSTPQ